MRSGTPPHYQTRSSRARPRKQFLFTKQKSFYHGNNQNYETVEKKEGTTFTSLELNGSSERVQSAKSGKFHATVKKTLKHRLNQGFSFVNPLVQNSNFLLEDLKLLCDLLAA